MLVALLLALGQRTQHMARSNNVPTTSIAATLKPGATLCQRDLVPPDARQLRILAGDVNRPAQAPPPALVVTAFSNGRRLSSARASGGLPGGVVRAQLQPATGEDVLKLCVRNVGRQPVPLLGSPADPGAAARVDGRPAPGVLRMTYFRGDRESWFEYAGTILQRFGVGKGTWIGGWALPAALFIVMAAWALAARALTLTSDS